MTKTVWTLVAIFLVVVLGAIFFVNINSKSKSQLQTQTEPFEGSFESKEEATGQSQKMVRKSYTSVPKALNASEISGKKARIKTQKGDIVIELFKEAPLASSNFIFLTNEKFYDGLVIHRRVEGFVIQGGDPNGDGTGGPGYQFADEKVTRDYKRGIVAMANAGPNTNGSQFFIMLADHPLSKSYTIFGQVVEGMEVVDKIQIGDVVVTVTIE